MANRQGYYSDEFDDSEEEIHVPKKKQSKVSPRYGIKASLKKSASSKKPIKRPASAPRKRPSSAPPNSSAKTPRELWIKSVQGGVGISPQKGTNNRGKTAVESWSDTLRRTGVGLNATSHDMNSFSGLKKNQTATMAYASTSHYLRQLAGTEKLSKKSVLDSPGRAAPGTPSYKSPEEYYDEIIALKKQITSLNNDNSTMKLKLRRLEEDNLKKEKEIEQLLDPSKSEDLRRTLGDRKPDSSTVIHSLKQKILKLEHQLKDKEAAFSKLQSDLKNTKVEEMKIQMESYYKEIIRLNQLKSVDAPITGTKAPMKESTGKLRALQETILRMNEKNLRLVADNKTLRQDLEKVMEENAHHKDRDKNREYEDMSKKQLLSAISKLEKRMDRADADSSSILSEIDSRQNTKEGKIILEGSVAQRLDQLDKRETELLEDMEKQRAVIKRLKEDRAHYRKKCEERDKEIKNMKRDIEELQAELDGFYDRDKITPRPTPRQRATTPRRPESARSRSSSISDAGSKREERERQRRIEQFRVNTAAKHIQRGWRQHRDEDVKRKRRRRDEEDERDYERRLQKAEELRQNKAARNIQRAWHQHHYDRDEAAEQIQSAMRGHMARRQHMGKMRKEQDDEDETSDIDETATDSDLDEAAAVIQSSVRGHWSRREAMRQSGLERVSKPMDQEVEDAVETVQSAFRGHRARKQHMARLRTPSPPLSRRGSTKYETRRLDSEGEDEESDDIRTTPRQHSARHSSGQRTPVSSRRKLSPRGRQKSRTAESDESGDDDDDEDIVVTNRGGKGRIF